MHNGGNGGRRVTDGKKYIAQKMKISENKSPFDRNTI
jgi:hypothetical protein